MKPHPEPSNEETRPRKGAFLARDHSFLLLDDVAIRSAFTRFRSEPHCFPLVYHGLFSHPIGKLYCAPTMCKELHQEKIHSLPSSGSQSSGGERQGIKWWLMRGRRSMRSAMKGRTEHCEAQRMGRRHTYQGNLHGDDI